MDSPTKLKKHSLTIAGHSTSITLEAAFWDALGEIARARRSTIAALIAGIDDVRADDPAGPNLSSAIRVFVLREKHRPER
jgi:predicted DNA-binding ribbon-helix-helix protein